MKTLFTFFITLFLINASAQTVNVTFRVDMSNQTLAATDTVTLNGTFNNWCGACTPMTNAGSGIWEITLPLPADSSFEYKYVIGAFASDEQLIPGSTCTVTNFGFTNRILTTGTEDMIIPTVCYGFCVACNEVPPMANVTFQVDMSNYAGDLSPGVTLNGEFNTWCGACTQMTDLGNDLYSITLVLATGSYQFKFTTGAFVDQENFTPGAPCTITTGDFTNRVVNVPSSEDMLVGPFYWGTCDLVLSSTDLSSAVSTLYPNPVSEVLNIEPAETVNGFSIFSVSGALILQENAQFSNRKSISVDNLNPGVYFIRLNTSSGKTYNRFVKF